ncbi:hypothetical protein PLICRDRAFT_390096 [Plicaturopsis crispa FD-325 SS-3]|nr:hypothetical protein PLICRDRAFT_390096 [Plicaturopsis crispa FD-325 SS-3]
MSPIEDSQATLHSRKTTPINLEVQPGPKTSRTDEPDGHENPTSTSLAEASPSDRPRQIRLDYARMTQDLKIPDYLSQELSGKKYFIWGEVDGASSRTCERETSYLTMSLRKHHAQDIRGKNWEMRPAAFVFVHASAMTTISSLPSLTYRRRDMAATFLCYGSDENMHPTPRGIREIFPARTGIVTFTANALLDDPAGICNLIANRDDRWECYILPTVVGLVAKTYGDATDALEREEFMHAWLLEAIEKGQLELLTSSPFSPASDAYVRCGRNLRRWGLDVVGCDAQELLKICVDAFASKHAHTREADWDRANEEEIKDFVLSLQAQPEVFSRYRRFVVIKGHDDKHIRWDANGLEWLALPQFHW